MNDEVIIPTAEEIASEIKMLASYKSGPFILVEGPSDVTFFAYQLDIDLEQILPTFGWENLVSIISLLHSEGLGNILGVIDLDYRTIVTMKKLPNDVMCTDSHDLEVMMFLSPAFQKVLKQKASYQKVKAFGSSYTDGINKIRKRVTSIGRNIGVIRLYSQLTVCNYSFNNLEFEKFIDRASVSYSTGKYISHMRGIHPNNASIPNDTLKIAKGIIDKIPSCKDPLTLCCGHDLMEIMAVGLKSLWGSHSSKDISGKSLEESFIFAYSHNTFKQTNLFRHMDKWFRSNGFISIWDSTS